MSVTTMRGVAVSLGADGRADALPWLPVDVPDALRLGLEWGRRLPCPGEGRTRELWEALATLAAYDVAMARAVEPHLDALAILHQAGQAVEGTDEFSWGVFAAEGGGDPLQARQRADGWMLDGTKPWCSLASRLDAALISAMLDDGCRGLFAVRLTEPGVRVDDSAWQARGLVEIPSGPVHFAAVPAAAVGIPGWYLSRPGFEWGGIGVAACWFGAAVGLARSVFAAVAASRRADAIALMHLGAIDVQLEDARRALAEAAGAVDENRADRVLSHRVRSTVARCCEQVIARAGHALGPAPLALDAAHAKRVADLQLYVRQHHAEKDEASLGGALVEAGAAPW